MLWKNTLTSFDQTKVITDASSLDWWTFSDNKKTDGLFPKEEQFEHTNTSDLVAANFESKASCKGLFDMQLLFQVDNASAFAAVIKMGKYNT